MRLLRGARQRYCVVDRLEFFVAGAVGFAGETAKFGARMTALEPPIAGLLAGHYVVRKAVNTIRSRYRLLWAYSRVTIQCTFMPAGHLFLASSGAASIQAIESFWLC